MEMRCLSWKEGVGEEMRGDERSTYIAGMQMDEKSLSSWAQNHWKWIPPHTWSHHPPTRCCVKETHKNPIHFWVFTFYFSPTLFLGVTGMWVFVGSLGYPQLYYLGTEPSPFLRFHVGDLPASWTFSPQWWCWYFNSNPHLWKLKNDSSY